ncbi:MAG: hypothetical protein SYC29_09480 [Planctomycetota bacterium]|nr:hypothetical protein [Planctomycetota bacterium]
MYALAQDCVSSLISSGNFIPVLAIGGGLGVAIVAIIFGTIKSMVVAKAREETKRELAAYVAEGSIDADKAIALARAGKTSEDE